MCDQFHPFDVRRIPEAQTPDGDTIRLISEMNVTIWKNMAAPVRGHVRFGARQQDRSPVDFPNFRIGVGNGFGTTNFRTRGKARDDAIFNDRAIPRSKGSFGR